eukprot:ANDGO_05261.mRNA.1 Oligosaccharide translocation protein RFT1
MTRSYVEAFSFLASLQFVARIVPFLANLQIARTIPLQAFGISNVQLQLLLSTVLFLSREPFRKACVAYTPSSTEQATPRRVNAAIFQTSLVVVPIGVVLSAFCLGYTRWTLDNTSNTSSSSTETDAATLSAGPSSYETKSSAYLVMVCSAVLELASEPYFNVFAKNMLVRERCIIEMAAILAKTLCMWMLVMFFKMDVMAYAWSQFACAVLILAGYVSFARFSRHLRSEFGIQVLYPVSLRQIFRPRIWSTVYGFSVQTLLKYLLQEGERIMLAALATADEQAVYSLAANLASLVARTILQPAEEMSYSLFSSFERHADPKVLLSRLHDCVLISLNVSYLFAGIGLFFSLPGIFMLYGTKWAYGTSAPSVVALYLFYILPMSLNGMLEAFVHARAASIPQEMAYQNKLLMAFSVVFLSAAAFLIPRYGAHGMILAHIVNSTVRATTHLWTTTRTTSTPSMLSTVRQLSPSMPTLLSFASTTGVLWILTGCVFPRIAFWGSTVTSTSTVTSVPVWTSWYALWSDAGFLCTVAAGALMALLSLGVSLATDLPSATNAGIVGVLRRRIPFFGKLVSDRAERVFKKTG